MKCLAAVAALSIGSLLAVAVSPAECRENDKRNFAEYCSSHGDLGLSHGACLAYFETRNVVPHDASVCQDPAIRRSLGVDNHGQCVKKLADMRR